MKVTSASRRYAAVKEEAAAIMRIFSGMSQEAGLFKIHEPEHNINAFGKQPETIFSFIVNGITEIQLSSGTLLFRFLKLICAITGMYSFPRR